MQKHLVDLRASLGVLYTLYALIRARVVRSKANSDLRTVLPDRSVTLQDMRAGRSRI